MTTNANVGGSHSTSNVGEVRMEGVNKVYIKEGEEKLTALEDCTFLVPKGKTTVLMGPSGCGKTVLINLIAGYENPTSGAVFMDGQPVRGPGRDRLVVFQESALFPWMTVFANVTFGCQVQGMEEKETKEKANRILNVVGLSEFRDKYPSQLSGGMQRRAELARAMINEPKIMLMDEPFRGLDAMTRQLMQEFYVQLYEKEGHTNLFITHEIDEAIFLADRLAIMTFQPGKIKAEIEVDLPRPRSFKMLASSRFMEIRAHALELLYEEATKALAAGRKSAFDLVGALCATTKDSCQTPM
jgi:NitT/TauT family transport system ATP-binding protein